MNGAQTDVQAVAGGSDGCVLFVSHSYGYRGDLMYYGEIFAALRRLEPGLVIGVDTATRFANPHGLDLRPLYRRLSMNLPARGGYARGLHLASPTLAWRVARLKPDVLVTLEFTPIALLAMAGSLASPRTKRVVLIESDPSARGAATSAATLALKRRAVALADVILTNNPAGAHYARQQLQADPARLCVAPYLTSRPPGGPARPRGGDGPVELIFANSLTERKNPLVLIEALAHLPPPVRSKLHLTIAGDGPLRPAVEQAIAERELDAIVTLTGAKSYHELGALLEAADVLVNPTRRDYRSLSSFEGLAYGLALLISQRDGAAAESVIEGQTGFLFDPDDPVRLARLIEQLVSNRPALDRMREHAAGLYRDRFSVGLAARNLANAIKRARDA